MLEKILKNKEKILVVGVGGGGDITSTLILRKRLKKINKEVTIGNVAWKRYEEDPRAIARKVDDFENIEKISETTFLINKNSKLKDGVVFDEFKFAKYYNEKILMVDVTKGVRGIINGLDKAIDLLGIDFIIGIDGGGDSLATGSEKTLKSPLIDAMMTAALTNIKIPSILCIFAYGCDGELTFDELNKNFAELIKNNGFLFATSLYEDEIAEMEEILKLTHSEVARLGIMAAKGDFGIKILRKGSRVVYLTPFSSLLLFFKTEKVYEHNRLCKLVGKTQSLEEANEKLLKAGVKTEYEWKKEALRKNGNV